MTEDKSNPYATDRAFYKKAGTGGMRQALAPFAMTEAFLTKNPNLDSNKIKQATKDYIGYGFDAAMRVGKIEGRKALLNHLKANKQSEDYIQAVMKDFDNKITSQKSDVFGKGDEIVDREFGGHVGGKSDHAVQSSRMVDLYRPKSKSYMGAGLKGSMQRSNILGAERPVIEAPSSKLAPVVAKGDQRGGLGASSLPPVRRASSNKQASGSRFPEGTAADFFAKGGSRDR